MKPDAKNRKLFIQIPTLLFAILLIGFVVNGKVPAGGNAAALGCERSNLHAQFHPSDDTRCS